MLKFHFEMNRPQWIGLGQIFGPEFPKNPDGMGFTPVNSTGALGWARRWRDLEALYADDLGGAAALSEFQLGLIGTCATLRCELEKLEGRLSVGGAIDLDQFGRLAGHYRRICETLGIERRRRDVTPDLQTYLAAKGAAADGT